MSEKKWLMIAMPKNQFDEDELFGVRNFFDSRDVHVMVFSPSGKEATGNRKTRFTPDGMIVDWNKFLEERGGRYAAVLIVGGKGAWKSLWSDQILPQILTDHHRAGCVIGAIGCGVPVLASATLCKGELAIPNDERVLARLDELNVYPSEDEMLSDNRVISASSVNVLEKFCTEVWREMNAGS